MCCPATWSNACFVAAMGWRRISMWDYTFYPSYTHMSHLLKYSVSVNKHPIISSPYSFMRFIVKGCSDDKVTWIFGVCMLSSPKSPDFKTLEQGVHENGLSYMGHSENEILGGTPLNMKWLEDFPCLIRNFSICHNEIFVASSDNFNSNWKITSEPHISMQCRHTRVWMNFAQMCFNGRNEL